MELEKVFKLIEAGFTKDEILSFTSGSVSKQSEEVNNGASKSEDTPRQQKEEKQEETQKEEKQEETQREVIARLDKMEKLMQKEAIQNSEQPKAQTTQELLEKILGGK